MDWVGGEEVVADSFVGFGHADQCAHVLPHGVYMIDPVHVQEPRHKLHRYTIRPKTVDNKCPKASKLTKLSSPLRSFIHNILDINLGVKKFRVWGVGFGELVQEVMDQEEMFEEVFGC